MNRSRSDRPLDDLVHETAQALGDIPVDGYGQVELRGTSWRAKNVGLDAVSEAQSCQVERVEGLVLTVRKPYPFEKINGEKV